MVKFMFGNYPPIEDGFIRCATVQSEAMLAKLLAEGIHQPTRLETNAHSKETSRCSSCDDSSQWCWNDAYTWMYDQCALRLNLPDMDSGYGCLPMMILNGIFRKHTIIGWIKKEWYS
jgi:hypothetical protein